MQLVIIKIKYEISKKSTFKFHIKQCNKNSSIVYNQTVNTSKQNWFEEILNYS